MEILINRPGILKKAFEFYRVPGNLIGMTGEAPGVLPGKVEAHIAKKKEQETTQDSLLTQTALAVGNVIGQLKLENPVSLEKFDVRDLTPEQFQELKFACVNHLSHLIPDIEKESSNEK